MTRRTGGEPIRGPGGAPSENTPAAFEYLTDDRLLNNPGLARMPTDQRTWQAFIIELNKATRNETGSFDPTFTGFSSDPATPSIWWHRFGQIVHVEFVFGTGTSDATDFTITNLPSNLTPNTSSVYPMSNLTNASTVIADRGSVKIGSDSVITFYSDNADGAWTGSGTKGFGTGADKSLLYSLRSPGQP